MMTFAYFVAAATAGNLLTRFLLWAWGAIREARDKAYVLQYMNEQHCREHASQIEKLGYSARQVRTRLRRGYYWNEGRYGSEAGWVKHHDWPWRWLTGD
jgi:hypothetical protein